MVFVVRCGQLIFCSIIAFRRSVLKGFLLNTKTFDCLICFGVCKKIEVNYMRLV